MINSDVVKYDFRVVPHTMLQQKGTHSEGTTTSTLLRLGTIAQVVYVSIYILLDHKGQTTTAMAAQTHYVQPTQGVYCVNSVVQVGCKQSSVCL